MRTIITGTREVTDIEAVTKAVELPSIEITELVSGKTHGADMLGEKWAERNNIVIRRFPANWDDLSHPDALIRRRVKGSMYDARAGLRRTQQMVKYAQALIAVWDGYSPCVDVTIRRAKENGLKVFIYGRAQPIWLDYSPVGYLPNVSHRSLEKYFYIAAKNVLWAFCACQDRPKFVREPTERMRTSCDGCKNSADIEELLKAKQEHRKAYDHTRAI